jgi:Spy/CpxP family protein refolding chaperone
MKNPLKILVLALIAGICLPSLAMARPGGPGLRGLAPERIDRMAERLELDAGTTDKIKDLVHQTQKEAIGIQARMETARLDLRQQLNDEDPDRSSVMAQIDQVAALKVSVKKLEVNLLLDVRGLLTPEQRTGLKKLIRRARKHRKRMRRGDRGSHGEKGKRRGREERRQRRKRGKREGF